MKVKYHRSEAGNLIVAWLDTGTMLIRVDAPGTYVTGPNNPFKTLCELEVSPDTTVYDIFEKIEQDAKQSGKSYSAWLQGISTVKTFIMSIIQDHVSFGGWVSFSHLKTMDALTGANVHAEFVAYCQKHGCTLTTKDGNTNAPWSDFRAFLLGVNPDD